jgi:hypothetical protein
MNTIEAVLQDIQGAGLTWKRANDGHAMYVPVYKREPVRMRVNDFPDEVAFTLFIRGGEFDLEERPKHWHLAPEE